MKPRYLGISIFLALATSQAHSYELQTHVRITLEAYQRSQFTQGTLTRDLGLDAFSKVGFDKFYFDQQGLVTVRRNPTDFEARKMRFADLPQINPSTISGWLLRGAIREDDVLSGLGDNPQDDPYGSINRVCGHFFDPFNNRGLTSTVAVVLCGTGVQSKAPDWALGTVDAFAQPSQPNPGRRNHFKVLDSRLLMPHLASISPR